MSLVVPPEFVAMVFVDLVAIGTGLFAGLEYAETVRDEVAGLLGEVEPCVGEAEDSHVAIKQRLALCGAASDVIVLAEDDQMALGGQGDPFGVFNGLSVLLSVDLGQRVDDQVRLAQD